MVRGPNPPGAAGGGASSATDWRAEGVMDLRDRSAWRSLRGRKGNKGF